MKKHSVRIGFFIFLTVLFSLLTVAQAADVQDTYYYPNYSVSKSGYVNLMNYMKDITITLNGKEYTPAQTEQLKSSGKQLEMSVGNLVSFNFRFGFCGRAYSASDRTLLDESKSTYTTYASATKFLNGKSAGAGQRAILDDSSLMKYTTSDGAVLCMDIKWLLDLCPEDYTCSFKGEKIAFRQGTGADSRYLYFYFPNGIGNDVYANDGTFSIDARIGVEFSKLTVPGTPGYFVPGTPWDFQVKATKYAEFGTRGNISSYGEITVKKVWAADGAHPDAKIVLSYMMNGVAQTATRTIKGNGSAEFTIREGMTDCVLSEDMTNVTDYRSDMTKDSTGKVFTFTNTRAGDFYFAKTDENGSMLSGAELAIYKVGAGDTRTLLESWTSGSSARKVMLPPGKYLLKEIKAPVGYAAAVDVPFEVTDAYALKGTDGDTVVFKGKKVTLTDRSLYVSITKTDNAGNPLSGAKIRIVDLTTDEVVDVWVSDGTTHTITKVGSEGIMFNSMHKYRLEEVSAPTGYKLANLIDFEFNADGTINGHPYRLFNIKNDTDGGGGGDDRTLHVSITKTDNEGKPLSGATIHIVDLTTNQVVDEWVSDGSTHTITKVGNKGVAFNISHKYRLEEVSAPTGYKLADLIDFEFNADGTIKGYPHYLINVENDLIGNSGDGPDDGPDDHTYYEEEEHIVHGNKEKDGEDEIVVNSDIERVQTGDSIAMWVELGLSVMCLAAAVIIFLTLRSRSDKRRGSDR